MCVYQRILTHYRIIVSRAHTSQARRDDFWNHIYRQNHIRVNLAVNRHHQHHDICVLRASIAPLLRDLVAYELDQKMPLEKQIYLFLFQYPRPSFQSSDLQLMSDDDLFDGYWSAAKIVGADTQATKRSLSYLHLVELKECAHCHSHEPARGDFSVCGGCKKVHYCGAESQRQHWREHKAACKQAAAAKAEI